MVDTKNDVNSLKQQRGQIKAKLTRFKTFISNLEKDKSKLEQLQIRKQNIEACYNEFDKIQTEIEQLEPEEDGTTERQLFEDNYFETIASANKILKANISTEERTYQNNQNQNASQYNNIKLPPIDIHKFNGATDQWLPFYNSFNSLVHTNPNIDNYQKLHYLKSSLTGPALDALDSLELTPDNYSVAYEYLQKRYKSTRLIVDSHVKAIIDLPVISRELPDTTRNLLDGYLKHIGALKLLNLPTEQWDVLLVHIMVRKFDYNTRREWENKLDKDKLPTMDELTEFLTNKCRILESMKADKIKFEKSYNSKPKSAHLAVNTNTSRNCLFCRGDHSIYYCERFLKLANNKRVDEIKKLRLCVNCLKPNHRASNCHASTCKKCHQYHNTLLHPENKEQLSQEHATMSNHTNMGSQALLSTAVINISNASDSISCRALLDPGSQSNFITNTLCKKLNLRLEPLTTPVCGIGELSLNIKYSTRIMIHSCVNKYKTEINCLVIPKITGLIPNHFVEIANVIIPRNIHLADPKFNVPSNIDLLIGTTLFWEILHMQQLKSPDHPLLQKTSFGWIVAGKFNQLIVNRTTCNLTVNKLENEMQKFWDVEQLEEAHTWTSEERECEQHFLSTHRRQEDGRFIVKLPFKNQSTELGASREIALKRLHYLEKKFKENGNLKERYSEFMNEYIKLGHMTLDEEMKDKPNGHYYMPHHCVIKETSLSTKLRVVFNGSSKTTKGISLNDKLMVGPTVQPTLFSIVTRFRTNKYVITADIIKMYRQIRVDKDDQEFQKILWRNETTESVKTYKLGTVSYGTACSPYLATRCLNQLAQEYQEEFPLEASIIRSHFYVDDLLAGAETIESTKSIRKNIETLLDRGGFKLSKWSSNSVEVLADVHSNEDDLIQITKDENIKTLGLAWNSKADHFQFDITCETTPNITKRTILSSIFRLFDPLGLISPLITKAKLIMQQLWQLKIGWDESVAVEIANRWQDFQDQLTELQQLRIERLIINYDNLATVELHGFADASEKAYGACIYARSVAENGQGHSRLIASKSRLALLKQISLPRLELSAAVLLSNLIKQAMNDLQLPIARRYLWVDSTITLAWIQAESRTWKTFVANRVAEIHHNTDKHEWNHVSGVENPANLISRGCNPRHLINSKLWWYGPDWLKLEQARWPQSMVIDTLSQDIPERKTINTVLLSQNINCHEFDMFSKFSTLDQLLRITAYVFRFMNNTRPDKPRLTKHLTVIELHNAMTNLVKLAQTEFADDISHLKQYNCVHKKSKILNLNPFLDENEIIRVGGRLKHSQLIYGKKYPILLPSGGSC